MSTNTWVQPTKPGPEKSEKEEKEEKEEKKEEKEEEKNEPVDDSDSDSDESSSDDEAGNSLLDIIQKALGGLSVNASSKTPPVKILTDTTVEAVADYIKSEKCKKIIVMSGAGVSVSAGIPDFRTPGTGLYDNLQKYNLPYPTAVFDIEFFRTQPKPFFLLAKELYPGNFKPTPAHFFIKLLEEKGLLLRNYTQNIDTLERVAGISPEKLVEAHGSFGSAHCINCLSEYSVSFVREAVFSDQVAKCTKCDGLVKPDIVFFGESLPVRFFELLAKDFPECDMLIVMGTSLTVQPFASLLRRVAVHVPRILINMEAVGTNDLEGLPIPDYSTGFLFNHPVNYRDVKLLGKCDDGVKKLVELLGWTDELNALISKPTLTIDEHASLQTKSEISASV
eukprot:TRINITY_DN2155_c0_g1_i1.p1 TRINITY_DN2155_c0_g1~~TRINITY_DN2155_c0_g1_i1.p1  ORF type:complete len:393 (-),score=93.93 TRINITY_DN2155_c0_g1_i1:28-1206(-)